MIATSRSFPIHKAVCCWQRARHEATRQIVFRQSWDYAVRVFQAILGGLWESLGLWERYYGPSLFVVKLCAFENWELPRMKCRALNPRYFDLAAVFTAQTPLEDPVRLRSCSAPRGDGASCSAFRCTMATAGKDRPLNFAFISDMLSEPGGDPSCAPLLHQQTEGNEGRQRESQVVSNPSNPRTFE